MNNALNKKHDLKKIITDRETLDKYLEHGFTILLETLKDKTVDDILSHPELGFSYSVQRLLEINSDSGRIISHKPNVFAYDTFCRALKINTQELCSECISDIQINVDGVKQESFLKYFTDNVVAGFDLVLHIFLEQSKYGYNSQTKIYQTMRMGSTKLEEVLGDFGRENNQLGLRSYSKDHYDGSKCPFMRFDNKGDIYSQMEKIFEKWCQQLSDKGIDFSK